MSEIDTVLKQLAAAVGQLGIASVNFGVSDEVCDRLAAAAGAAVATTVYRDSDGTHAIDWVSVTRGDFEFKAQRRARAATAAEVAQVDRAGRPNQPWLAVDITAH